jgi:hypothetical protein
LFFFFEPPRENLNLPELFVEARLIALAVPD